jgi:hypothetical protein
MQDRKLFEYAILRAVPRVEREEFVNIGVVMYCRELRQVKVKFEINAARLKALNPEFDLEQLRKNLEVFENICKGIPSAGPIALLDAASRFRWLTATRSTILQLSRVHPGLCEDADACLEKLFREQVS